MAYIPRKAQTVGLGQERTMFSTQSLRKIWILGLRYTYMYMYFKSMNHNTLVNTLHILDVKGESHLVHKMHFCQY